MVMHMNGAVRVGRGTGDAGDACPPGVWREVEAAVPLEVLTSAKFDAGQRWLVLHGGWGRAGVVVSDGRMVYGGGALGAGTAARLQTVLLGCGVAVWRSGRASEELCVVFDRVSGRAWVGAREAGLGLAFRAIAAGRPVAVAG
jgi:hypothetical protein